MNTVPHPPVPLPPASGAWREGDPAGRRQWYVRDRPLPLEAGGELPSLRLAFETWGRLAPDRSNAVLVLHALTGDSHVTGPAGPGHPTPGWWDGLIGPGRALDTDRWFVVAPNVLGGCQGSTGPSSLRPDGRRWGSSFPFLTQRDQVAAEAGLADSLGIDRWALVAGGSMGGMRALEWAVSHPERAEALLLLACPAAAGAEQIAWAGIQVHAIRSDPHWRGGDYHDAGPGQGPHNGLGLARRLAHVTYRSEPELQARFGRAPQGTEDPWAGGRHQVASYLDHHAAKLVRRFDAGTYVVLTQAMNSHDAGRARGGTAAALRRVTARTLVAGVDSDRLYPLAQQAELAAGIPTADRLRVIGSPHGHDGFLIETDQVAALVRELTG
ncbi:homoserine O-acetyltransferase MetX [Streptantibioticus silvisoli]|uniref:Homoserine O-acetyltransferase n=1 Tax=Streptantibioticus silvisoli TaxID=2705255 RepID=A0ABT6W423_9ACTN|nr:homoserine O-acetyltransferase [Streptantibioticus silvisoli]MDI5965502.1 homoserine O-acetyltransferase [Streptantibioticus silvisoli]